jgi:regulator of replication initiation timing
VFPPSQRPSSLIQSSLRHEKLTLNLRINDMLTQLSSVMKTMMDENTALKKENADLKAKQ